MNIPVLPNWAILRSRYAFEDTESNTAIEQTARLYKAIGEIIDSCNEFSKVLQEEMKDFTTNQSIDYETKKANLDKIVHDYIAMLDNKTDVKLESYETKIVEQDTKLNEAVKYMTDNLSDYVDEVTGDVIESKVNEQITVSLGTIETRVSTLEKTEYKVVYDATTEEINLVKEVVE